MAEERWAAEPVWRPVRRLRRATVPEHYLPWLLDSASLTQRVVAACDGCFRVQLLAQEWRRSMRNEAAALGIPRDVRALVRQVRLLCNEVPWVYARTVIPASTLTGRGRRLAHLRSRSLGAVLFADPAVQRDEVEVTRLAPGDPLFRMATRGLNPPPPEIWGRRSIFRIGGKPLLVSEIFLPALPPFGTRPSWHVP